MLGCCCFRFPAYIFIVHFLIFARTFFAILAISFNPYFVAVRKLEIKCCFRWKSVLVASWRVHSLRHMTSSGRYELVLAERVVALLTQLKVESSSQRKPFQIFRGFNFKLCVKKGNLRKRSCLVETISKMFLKCSQGSSMRSVFRFN